MLNKKKIDKKLKEYIKEHLSKGYSKHSIKKVLIGHGYDESYVDGLFKKHYQLKFVKISSVLISLLFIISIFAFNLIPIKQQVTGYFIISSFDEGCCTSICQQTSRSECYGKFVEDKKCDGLNNCNVGCCIDKESYCLTNYLYGNCIEGNGTHINKDCIDIIFCANITDKSYGAKLYSIKIKGDGILTIKPLASYYKSFFNILYYIYDKTNVLSISANIKDNGQLIDSITLYDDGSHNDGSNNDNLYGDNWDSSKIKAFDGFKKLDIDIVMKYTDGTQQVISKPQGIVILNNNKCLPIYNEFDKSKKYSIIFAANNYEAYGFAKFESDVQNFLDILFSIDKFSNNRQDFNIYRLEQSLSYFNIPTLVNIIGSNCPSYSNKKDLVVMLDYNEEYCISEGLRVARVNPQVLFYKNISNVQINQSFADFCNYVLTPKKLADDVLSFATPPKIVVYTLDNITYNTSTVNLSFTISALNYPVDNSVFLNETLISIKIFNEEVTDSIILTLFNGSNEVLITAIDSNDNVAFAQLLLNATI